LASASLGGNVGKLAKGTPMNTSQHALFDWVSGGLDIPMRKKAGSLTDSVFNAANIKIETYNTAFKVIKKHIDNRPKP
jgi:hypothetical protein